MALCTTLSPTPTTAFSNIQTRTSRLLAQPGELKLRVLGPGHDGQVVKVRSPKCTIGSAAGCTLRLRAAGVGPLQCWVLRGAGGTIVRRVHGPALLNGGSFDEAALRIGDRLRIGPVELEVMECNQPVLAPAPLFPPPAAALGEVAQLKSELVVIQERAKRLEAESRQGFESSIMAAERDQLRDALAAAHEQLEEVCRELTAAQDTLNTQAEELEGNHRQLDELHANQRSLATQLDEAHRLTAAKADEQVALVAELHQVRASLDQQREQFDAERAQLERRLAQRDAELDAVRSTAAAQTGAMTVAISELSETQQSLKDELTAKCVNLEAQLASKQAEVDELRRAFGDQAEQQARHEQLARDYEQKCAALADSQAQAAALAASTPAAAELQAREQSLTCRQEELAAREANLSQSQHELLGSREVIDSQNQQLVEARQQLEAREQALASRQDELAVRETNLGQSEQQLSTEQQTTAAQNQQLAEMRQGLEAERDELLLQRQELADEQTRLSQLQFQLEQKQEWLLADKAQRQTLEGQEVQLLQQTAELEAQIAAATARLGDVEQLREQLLEQRALLAERAEQLDARQRELEQRAAELVQQAVEMEALGQELSERQAVAGQACAAPDCTASIAGDEPSCPPAAELQQPLPAIEPGGEMPVNMTAMWSPNELEASRSDFGRAAAVTPLLGEEQRAPVGEQAIPGMENLSESRDVDLVLSRLVQAGLWRNDEQQLAAQPGDELPTPAGTDSQQAMPLAVDVEAGAEPASPPAEAASLGGDEESIESYMDRLMKRVRGDSPSSKSGWKPAAQPAAASAAVAVPPMVAATPPEPAEEASEYSPRRTAPELGTSMSAMRELANSAARSAIDLHVRQRTSRQVVGRLVGACFTVTASIVLGYWAYRVQSLQAAVGAGIGGAVGGYWSWAAIRRFAALRRVNQAQAKQAKQAAQSPPAVALPTMGHNAKVQ